MISLGFAVDAKISILAFNRPEWVIADLATMMAGGVPAGIIKPALQTKLPTSSPLNHIVC